ncbi:GtrA family protein [uncultured Merdimonas sp.]|uniref:GtrA family protein n=1 Tax=uncultured Merdimonas sp. TaxID=2023269 RepID=UPI00320AD1AA
MKQWILKYKEMILYLFFGGCTTLVNILAYAAATRFVSMAVVPATVLAWILSVIFAYVTNRIYVFESKTRGIRAIGREVAGFVSCRLFSGALDVGLMWLLVDMAGFPDLVIKILSNILVIIINYVASKFWIFKK